jgi:hypothetical protein
MTPRSRSSEMAACWACSTVMQKPKRTLSCQPSRTLRVLALVPGSSEWHRMTTGSLLARSLSGSAGAARALVSWSEESEDLVDSQLRSPAMAHRTLCGAGPRSRHGLSVISPTRFRPLDPSCRRTSWPSSTTYSTCGSDGSTHLTLHGGRSWQRPFLWAPDRGAAGALCVPPLWALSHLVMATAEVLHVRRVPELGNASEVGLCGGLVFLQEPTEDGSACDPWAGRGGIGSSGRGCRRRLKLNILRRLKPEQCRLVSAGCLSGSVRSSAPTGSSAPRPINVTGASGGLRR